MQIREKNVGFCQLIWVTLWYRQLLHMAAILEQNGRGSFKNVLNNSYRYKRIDDFQANQPKKDLAKVQFHITERANSVQSDIASNSESSTQLHHLQAARGQGPKLAKPSFSHRGFVIIYAMMQDIQCVLWNPSPRACCVSTCTHAYTHTRSSITGTSSTVKYEAKTLLNIGNTH